MPQGFNRDVEKIIAASAMSSTMPGAAGRGHRLQHQQITVDDTDGVQAGIQAKRLPADGRQTQLHGSAGVGLATIAVLRRGNHQALYRGQDFAQWQLRGQGHLGQPAVRKNGDADDLHDGAGHQRDRSWDIVLTFWFLITRIGWRSPATPAVPGTIARLASTRSVFGSRRRSQTVSQG